MAFGLVLLSCGRDVTGPGTAAARFARGLSFAAIFPPLYQQASGSSGVAFNHVHVVLHRADGTVALDTVVNFPSDSTILSLSLTVPLLPSAPASGEPLSLNLGYVNAAGDTVFKGGPIAVTAAPYVPGQPPPPPVSVPVAYTGPGASASTVRIAPKSLNIFIGDRFTLGAQALDPDGKAISGTPIIYASLDNAVATLSSAGSGAGIAVGRGTARIVAQLLTGPVDTAIIQVQAHATTIATVSGDGQTAITGATLTQPVVVKVAAADGLGVSGVSVAFSASGGGTVGAGTVVTDANGLAQTTWKLGPTAGAQTLSAAATGLTGSPVTFNATANQAPATKLAVTTQPTSGRANAAIAPPVTVTAQDVNGNTTTAFTGPVTVALGSNTAGATLGGTTTVNATAGVATFSGLTVNKAGTGYTLVASSGALTIATSNAFDITVGSATKLAFTVAENGSTGGAILTPAITVAAEDSIGNVVTGFTGTVQLSIGNNPTGATLSGTTSVSAVAGIATFPDIRVDHAGSYTLVASSTGLTASTSPGFDVIVGPAAQILVVSGGGQTAPSGATLTPIVVQVSDAGTNGVAGKNMSFAVTSGGGTVTPTTAVGDGQGRASFTWTLGGAAGVQTVTVTSPGVTPVVVSATASGNGATQLVVTTQPGATYAAGASITPTITIEARNAVNALSTAFAGSVSIAIGTNPGTSTLSGTATVTAVAGVATFAGLSLNKSGAGYTLVASSSGLTSATTTSFAITPGPATSIVISAGNFQNAAPSTVLTGPIVAHVVDALGNGVSGKTVTFVVATGGGSVSVASAVTDAAGNAQSIWTLGVAAGPQTLTIASVGLTGSPLTATANGGGGAVASTVVTPHLDTLTAIGATFGLAAQAKDISLANVAGTFVWVSRVPSVATVNTSGVVTGVTNGSTWVVATESGGTKDSTFIVVQQRLATINVSPGTRNIYLAASFPFAASAVDGLGVAMASQPVFTWSTASSAISSITAAGVATGVGLGSTQVRATSGATVGIATLNVLTPITRIVVSRDSAGFSILSSDTFTVAALGRTRSYKATAYDTLNSAMSGISFTFGSSNPAVAAIDSTGATTARAAVAANGSTSISASAQGITGAALLKVRQLLTAIDLSPVAVTVAQGGSTALLARGKDAGGFFIPGGAFVFTSSSPANATISATTGLVTGVLNGSATIVAKDSATSAITSNNAIVTVGPGGPAIISFGRDTLTVGRSGSASIPILLSKPNALPLTINLAVRDTFAFFSPTSIVIPAGSTSGNATLNGHNAGSTLIYASDGSSLGYTPDTAVLAVQASVRFTTTNYGLAVNDQLSTQILLTDPSPAGGTFVTYSYGTAGRAAVSPDPAFIPAGQLAANVVIVGTGAGSTTITPAATGVNGTATTVTTYAAVLTIYPSSLRLGAGQFEYNEYVYAPTNLYTPLSVTLASADTNIVTVPTPLTIPTSSYNQYFNTTGKIPGVATVTASSAGWTSGTMAVTVTSPKLGICCGGGLNTTSPAQGVIVYAEDSLSSAHYRTSSLAFQLTSSDTNVLKVLTPTRTMPAGQYYENTGQVIPGGLGGTAYLKVTASGHKPDSVLYTVVGPKLSFSWYSSIVGAGQQDPSVYITTPNPVTAPLTVSISNPDSSIVGLPSSIIIATGTNVTSFNVRGKAVGTETFIATAPGYQPDTAFYTVTTPRLYIASGSPTLNFATPQSILTYSTDSTRNGHYRTTPLVVTYTSTNPAVLTVTNSSDTIQTGSFYANQVQVTPVGVGTAKIIVTAPGHGSDSVTYTVQTPQLNFNFSRNFVGRRQYESSVAYVQTPNNRPVPVTVTITHTSPAVDSLSSTSLIIPANQYYLFFGYAGLAVGSDTLTATAPGYLSTTAIITVTTPKFIAGGLPSTALTTSSPATVTVYTADSLGSAHNSLDTIALNAVSSNAAVVQPTAPVSHLNRGVYYVQPLVSFTGPGTASMIYSDSAGRYAPVTTSSVTVTGPSLSIINYTTMLGMRQNGGVNSAYIQLANPVAVTPLVVNLVSTDTTVVTVPATVTVPVGATNVYFQITAHDVIGTIQIQATATGYGGTNTSVQVTAPKFVISTIASTRTTAAPQAIVVYAEDANGTAHYTNENVSVSLASSSTAVGTIDSATVVIPLLTQYNSNARFTPGSAGTTQLTASDVRVQGYHYNAATQNVAVNTPTLSLSWSTANLGIGQYDDQTVQAPDNQVAPRTVSLAHFNSASTTSATVIIPANIYYTTVRVTGASTGTDTITASTAGHNPVKGAVVVGLGRVDTPSGWPSTLSLTGTDSVLVTMYARDQTGSSVHYVAAATTFTLTGSANVGFSSGTAAITSVTIPANAQYVQFYVKGLTAGTSSVTITNANYTTYSPSITVTP